MRTLGQLKIQNYKSIREQTIRPGRLNLFIGGNGSGKSNLIGIFKFFNRIVDGRLQEHTGIATGANSILHFGRKHSPTLTLGLSFKKGSDSNGYSIKLKPTDDDRFVLILTNGCRCLNH